MTKLTPFEFLWLLRLLQTSKKWEHKRVSSRFVLQTLTKRKLASNAQLLVLRYNMMFPYSEILNI